MGYFSNRAIDRRLLAHDHSDTPPEKQLLWRLEALEDRLCELTGQDPGNRAESDYFSKNDLRYVLPKHILSADLLSGCAGAARAMYPAERSIGNCCLYIYPRNPTRSQG